MSKKLISIISPCYNEEENIEELYRRVTTVIKELENYDFEYLFIDNASTDSTVEKLKLLAGKDKRVKIIVNNRNFGHIRSPYWGILQTKGDATIYLASDLQDPPELISRFLHEWENGYLTVMAVKPRSDDNKFIHSIRKMYYLLLDKISDIPITKDTTGFGLYDKKVINRLKRINDPYPYLRGLIDELGYSMKCIEFKQPIRTKGITKNNIYTLYDIAMLGIVSHSMVPIRMAAFIGFILGLVAFFAAIFLLVLKVIWWDKFAAGVAPLYIIICTMFGFVMLFIGILGEYIGSIHTYVKNRPIVIEKERVNFEK